MSDKHESNVATENKILATQLSTVISNMKILEKKIKDLKAENKKWKEAAKLIKAATSPVINEFLYFCLKWQKCLDQQDKGSWLGRARAREEWFSTAEKLLPRSKEEIRQALNKIKEESKLPQ